MHPNAAVIYDEYRDFSRAGMKDAPTRDQMYDKITLPADRQWLKPKKVHPLILKVLERAICSTLPKFRMDMGRSDEGAYLAFAGADHYEFFRLTVRKTNPKYKTDEHGLWFMGTDVHDVLPDTVGHQSNGLMGHVFDVLKVLQVEGRDGDSDIEHMGHYVESNITGFSRTNIVFRVGGGFWILSHTSRQNKMAVGFRALAALLMGGYKGDDDKQLHAVTRLKSNTNETAIGLYDAEDAGTYGEMIADDMIVEISEVIEAMPSMDYLYSQAPLVRRQLTEMSVADPDYRVSVLTEYLATFGGENHMPYHLIAAPDQRYVDVRYYCNDNRSLYNVRIFRTPK